MGGSGGGGFRGSANPGRFVNRLESTHDETRQLEFEQQVSDVIARLLAEYNDRDAAGIQEHIKTVRDALNKDGSVVETLVFAGSVAKHTYVDGISDVDALVFLDPAEVEGMSPAKVRKFFEKRLKERLPNSKVQQGNIAVTLTFSDGVVLQLVPVFRSGTALAVSSENGKDWVLINPKAFTRTLRKSNDALAGKLVPTIKLAKAIISALPADRRLSGYHTEALSVKLFDGYLGKPTVKDMLAHFFRMAPSHILNPIADRTGQTRYVDEYLGPAGSFERELAADAIDRIGRRMRNADLAVSLEMWKALLEVV
jgi:hypothetical protein